ncbi:MAG: RNA polymerase sigma factor [Planctomycetota bacterium]
MEYFAPESDSDVKLMLSFKNGDESAFGQLITKHSIGLINYFYRQGVDRSIAEDFCQEVFIKLYEYRKKYTATAKFTTFLYRMAHNHFIDYCRSRKNKPHLYSIDEPISDESEKGRKSDLIGKTENPMESLVQGELKNFLEDAINTLPPDQREVFVLSEIHGMKYAEISEILGIPVGTVKSRMFNSIQKLRSVLTLRGITP